MRIVNAIWLVCALVVFAGIGVGMGAQTAGQAPAAPSANGAATAIPKLAPGTTKEKSGCWPWPDSMDAVRADPENHIVMYEDENVRFVDVHTPPGQTNSKHDHQWLSVFLQDQAQPKGRDHGTDGSAGQGGGVIGADAPFPLLNVAGTQAPHAYENMDTFTKHFYRAELKKIPFECPAPNGAMVSYAKERMTTLPEVKVDSWPWPDSMDQIITSPKTEKVRFEVYDIRLIEVTIPPGGKQEMGEQLYPSVLIFYEPQPKGVMTSYDGKTAQVDRKFTDGKFPQAIREGKQPPHAFENKDNFPAHYYRVEFMRINYKG